MPLKQPPAAAPRRGKRTSEDIRTDLLDAAEQLFAQHGFHGVAVRAITAAAGSRLADINDHFGSKDALFQEVVRRRASVINADRTLLLQALPQRGALALRLRRLVEAFALPWLQRGRADAGWQAYLRLIAQMSMSRSPELALVADQFNPVAMDFVLHLQALAPQASQQVLLQAYQLMVTSSLTAFANNYRVNVLSGDAVKSEDFDAQYEAMVRFVSAGLLGLLGPP